MLEEYADDVEEVVVAWLNNVIRSAITRRNNDPLPFALVRHIDGKEDPNAGTADHLVSVRVLCDKSLGEDAAAATCLDVHRQMLELARYLPDIYLESRGHNASVDYVTVTQSPRWTEYANDEALCKTALYTVGLAYS